jgi:Mn-dependent DtxR family transcriptional regulator
MARYSPTSGGYANLLSQLKTAGLIDYPSPGLVTLTKLGTERGTPQLGVKRLENFHTA